MELVGRDLELAVAARAVDDVRGGAGAALGVLGEAGIGKTELLSALADQAAAAGLAVFRGRCAEHERDVPFGVVVDAFGECDVDVLGPLPQAAGERFRRYRTLGSVLERVARKRPVALVLDDLHWADEASVEVLLHLLRRPPQAACLLAFALRPGERAERLMAAAPSRPFLTLAPLADDAAATLLAGLPDARLRERVLREAAGNPLFLHELARVAAAGETALPATLAAVVRRDMAALEPRRRALLEGAAVAGDPFDPELAAEAAGLEPDAATLDALVTAGLVRATGHGRSFTFRHPLVRRAVYEATPPAWRLEAHERAAAALACRGAGAAVRAYHLEPSAQPGDESAIAVLTEAAVAARTSSPASAAHWYAAALRLLPAGEDRRAELLGARAVALANAGRLEESRSALLELQGERRADVTIACAQVETALGRHHEARRRLIDALDGAAPADQAAVAFELAADAMTHGRSLDLRLWARHAARMAEGVEPVLLAGARALGALGAIWAAGTAPDVHAPLDHLDDQALEPRVGVALHIARAQLRLGRYEEAHATTTRVLAICRRSPRDELLVWLRALRAWTFVLLLDLDAALLEAELAEESARLQNVPHVLMLALCKRVLVHDQRGELLEAERAAAECEQLMRALEASAFTAHVRCNIAALVAESDPERAIRELQAAAGPHLEATDPSMSSTAKLVRVRAAIAAGRLEDAERYATRAVARAGELGLPVAQARAACGRAEVLLARGETAHAEALSRDAAATAERLPAPLDAADARLLVGRALAAAGRAEEAKTVLQQVVATAGRGGALRLRDAAARELRRLGSRPSAVARRARPEPLSERERDIAALVAGGRSNKEVGAALYVSEKTVRNTLTRVYAKLGVRSRTELVRRLSAGVPEDQPCGLERRGDLRAVPATVELDPVGVQQPVAALARRR